MTTLHPFSASWESILLIWSSTAQSRRLQPDAQASHFAHSTLNPYLSVRLTLAAIAEHAILPHHSPTGGIRLTGPHTRPSSRYSHRSAFWVSMYKAIPNALPILLPVNQPVNPPSPFEDEDDDLKIDMCVHKRI
ncbi:hypothetical protein M405DRAFT_933689 [Rhizopogon salebrosus TDB-379]|nr:hypothetical protein M405DRAFT_933689 [Rhizopogon salebrosus TDB-379]